MIDTSVARAHQHGACIADNNHQTSGLISKSHAGGGHNGLQVHLALTPGEAHDNGLCSLLLSALLPKTMLLADTTQIGSGSLPAARRVGQSFAETQSQRPDLLQRVSVSRPQLDRTVHQQDEQFRRVATRYESSQQIIWRSSNSHHRVWLLASERVLDARCRRIPTRGRDLIQLRRQSLGANGLGRKRRGGRSKED